MNFNVNVGGGFGGGFTQQREPLFQKIAVGAGIDNNEYQTIINCCKQAYLQNQQPLSTTAGKYIKQYLGFEWLVIVSPSQDKNYEFSLTSVEGGDFLAFVLDSTLFQVCKIDKF